MLTKKQQKFMVKLLERRMTKKDNGLYNSKAFYRIASYLMRNNLITSVKLEDNINQYSLTITGSILARLLAGLEDVDEQVRRKFGIR